jgi:hypothetical protein
LRGKRHLVRSSVRLPGFGAIAFVFPGGCRPASASATFRSLRIKLLGGSAGCRRERTNRICICKRAILHASSRALRLSRLSGYPDLAGWRRGFRRMVRGWAWWVVGIIVRESRNARRVSGGWYLPGGVPIGAVRSIASCLSALLAAEVGRRRGALRSFSDAPLSNPLCALSHNGLYVQRPIMCNAASVVRVFPAQRDLGWRGAAHNHRLSRKARSVSDDRAAHLLGHSVSQRIRLLAGLCDLLGASTTAVRRPEHHREARLVRPSRWLQAEGSSGSAPRPVRVDRV